MKVITVSHSDVKGGADRAAYRIHHALRKAQCDSMMMVNDSNSGDWTVIGPAHAREEIAAKVRPIIGKVINKSLKTKNKVIHSSAFLPSSWPKRLNTTDAALVHLHWVNKEMMSISDVSKISKPLVWTLHDMWSFCGAEHYTQDYRWRDGYTYTNRPSDESGFDLNRWVWKRKHRLWKKPIHIVTPSSWLAECASESVIMREWPITVIPNAIDTDVWKPVDKDTARQLLNLPVENPILLFGALEGVQDPRKGFDLLKQALEFVQGEIEDLHLVIFGQLKPKQTVDYGFPVHYTGHVYDDLSLRVLYSAADVMVIPSRQDNLPNTGVEALACGTPVLAFNACGLPDIVQHKFNGYLANNFDPKELAEGMRWLLNSKERRRELSLNARQYAVQKYSYSVVADSYLKLYQSILSSSDNAAK